MKRPGKEKIFPIALGIYTILHLSFRLFISASLEKDEAEMILYAQQPLSWGYNSQPPLYVWLQLTFFRLLGMNILALSLLKNILIFIFYYFLYRSAKIILADNTKAAISTLSLLLVYNFSWIMHKDLTHTVLLMAICSLTFYILVKMTKGQKIRDYLLLGIFIGLGIMSKYNYLIFLISLLIAGLCLPNYRKIIIDKKVFLTVFLIFFISGGHFIWAVNNPDLLTSDIADFQINDDSMPTFGLKGALDLLKQSALFMAPLIAVYIVFFPNLIKRFFAGKNKKNDTILFLEIFFISAIILTLFLCVFSDIGKIKARWLSPFLFLLPLYFFLKTQGQPIKKKRELLFLCLVAFCALSTLFSVWGRILFASQRDKYNRLNYPYSELSKLISQEGFQEGTIIAEDQVIAANLKLWFPDSFAVVAQDRLDPAVFSPQTVILIVWEDKVSKGYPKAMKNILKHYNLLKRQPLKKTALYKYSKNEYYHLNIFIVKNINI